MPFVNIEGILFTDSDNTLLITINYYIANSPNLDQIVLELNSASE